MTSIHIPHFYGRRSEMKQNEIRASFPFFEHNPGIIWLDSASTAQKPRCVAESLTDFYNTSNSNIYRAEYPLSDNAEKIYVTARKKVADFFSVENEKVAFTHSATDSLNIAAESLSETVRQGDNVIISSLEHNSSLLPWMRICKEKGAEIRFIPLLRDGSLDTDAMIKMTDRRTRAAVVTAGSNVSGCRPPLDMIGDHFESRRVPLVIDAAQSAPHGTIDASCLKFHYMCASSHKMYGPTGVGMLIFGKADFDGTRSNIGGGTVDEVTADGYIKKNGVRSVEAGTPDVAGAHALGASLDFLRTSAAQTALEEEFRLADKLRFELTNLGMKLVPGGNDPLPIVSFTAPFMHSLDLSHILGTLGVCVRSGRHCAHIMHSALGLDTTVRASLGIYSTEDDILSFIEKLKYIKEKYD